MRRGKGGTSKQLGKEGIITKRNGERERSVWDPAKSHALIKVIAFSMVFNIFCHFIIVVFILAIYNKWTCMLLIHYTYNFWDYIYMLFWPCNLLDCDIHYCYKLHCGSLFLRFAICTLTFLLYSIQESFSIIHMCVSKVIVKLWFICWMQLEVHMTYTEYLH